MGPFQAFSVESGGQSEAPETQRNKRGGCPVGWVIGSLCCVAFCAGVLALILGLIPIYIRDIYGVATTTTTASTTTASALLIPGNVSLTVTATLGTTSLSSSSLLSLGRMAYSASVGRQLNACGIISGTIISAISSIVGPAALAASQFSGTATFGSITPSCTVTTSPIGASISWISSFTVNSATVGFSATDIVTGITQFQNNFFIAVLNDLPSSTVSLPATDANTITLNGQSTQTVNGVTTTTVYANCVYSLSGVLSTGSANCLTITTSSSATTAASGRNLNNFYWK